MDALYSTVPWCTVIYSSAAPNVVVQKKLRNIYTRKMITNYYLKCYVQSVYLLDTNYEHTKNIKEIFKK